MRKNIDAFKYVYFFNMSESIREKYMHLREGF